MTLCIRWFKQSNIWLPSPLRPRAFHSSCLSRAGNKLIGTLKDTGDIMGYFWLLAEVYYAVGLRIHLDDREHAEQLLAEDY